MCHAAHMTTLQKIKERIQQLVDESEELSRGHGDMQACRDAPHVAECVGWFAATANVIQLVCPRPLDPYRMQFDLIKLEGMGVTANRHVGEGAAVLRRMLADIEDGLLSSVADQAAAETFDDFLDHAEAYLRENDKNPAGVIAGVVFEDTIRRICTKNKIAEKGRRFQTLINKLTKAKVLTALQAKRIAPSAHVRIKATHAQWDEFDAGGVDATIKFTRELLHDYLT